MKILRIYLRIPPKKGGMEKHIYFLTKEQIELGHDVTVFFNEGEPITINDKKFIGFNLSSFKPNFLGVFIFYSSIIYYLFSNKMSFDVVHIHGDWSSLIFSNIIKKLVRARVLAFSFHDEIKSSLLYNLILKQTLKKVDVLFSTGYKTAKSIQSRFSKNVFVQPSGINRIFFDERAYPKNSKLKIITVANLVEKKNLSLVLDIAQECPSYDFLIVGEGPEKEILEQKIKKEKILNMTLMGYRTPEEIKELYSQSNVFLLTSFKEGTPTSLLEALACGLFILSSNAGEIENIIQKDLNGAIIKTHIKQHYIEVLLQSNDKLLQETYSNNKILSRKFDWKNVAKAITSKYCV